MTDKNGNNGPNNNQGDGSFGNLPNGAENNKGLKDGNPQLEN